MYKGSSDGVKWWFWESSGSQPETTLLCRSCLALLGESLDDHNGGVDMGDASDV